jgi:peptide-methionine (R)-S-oxide reductase
MEFDKIDLKDKLTPLQYRVTQEAGTERPFSGEYWDTKEPGVYHCIVCDVPLFASDTKYDSGSGWPSFWEALDPKAVALHVDKSLGMVRTEVTCANCGAHLGHLFPDGPQPTGQRYCMNSASMKLDKAEDS